MCIFDLCFFQTIEIFFTFHSSFSPTNQSGSTMLVAPLNGGSLISFLRLWWVFVPSFLSRRVLGTQLSAWSFRSRGEKLKTWRHACSVVYYRFLLGWKCLIYRVFIYWHVYFYVVTLNVSVTTQMRCNQNKTGNSNIYQGIISLFFSEPLGESP